MSGDTLLIRPATAADAEDLSRAEAVTRLINEAYRWSEAELWIDEKERTDIEEVSALIAAGKLLLGFTDEALIGVVKVEKLAPDLGSFGMLATDANALQRGTGRALVTSAEDWARKSGLSEMEIEIVRAETPNAHKRLLHDWYRRLGYIEQQTYPIAERIPEIAPLQRQPCVSTVYRKRL